MDKKELSIKDKVCFKLVELFPWDTYKIHSAKIVTVIQWEVFDRTKWTLKTFESGIYYEGVIEARVSTLIALVELKNEDIVLNKINVDKEFGEYCRHHWTKWVDISWNKEDEKLDLYRSHQVEYEFMWTKYIWNCWFCWKNVDCGFHNEHDFIEVHTCIAWDWYMQKSIDWTDKTLIETVWLLPWNTHRVFAIEGEYEENWDPKYPFHRWLWWNTWNVWLVIEKY